ncbi:MAG TPA: prenyltransferase/squalene oxidase repeat-containing protein, partial [Planctomycetia bacterium]|nr:prenyltransferase/squalene oxidase repeat-containing protein [Planctomycetia bacterium]
MRDCWKRTCCAALACLTAAGAARAADEPNPYEAQIRKGRAFIYGALKDERRLGYLALGTLALQKTTPKGQENDPELKKFVQRVAEEVDKDASELKNGNEWNYCCAVCIMCLIADDINNHEQRVRKLVRYLMERQTDKGGWAYSGNGNNDTSQCQYAILALWDAAEAGVEVPRKVWDAALYFHIMTQDAETGGFVYHPDYPTDNKPKNQGSKTATMGVAGLGSMIICRDQLPALRKKAARHMDFGELIRPARDEETDDYVPKCTFEMAQQAITRAEAWVNRFSGMTEGTPTFAANRVYYYLYGLERAAALRRGGKFKESDWYGAGASFLVRKQKADGKWEGEYAGVADTAFGIMFLGRVMQKKVQKISFDQLARSTMISGRGIPTGDGSSASAWQRQVERYRTQPTTSIDDLVKSFDDPNAFDLEENASAKIEQLKPEQLKELIQKLGGDQRKLRQWAYDSRPEARKFALTALARTRDFRVVPILLDGLDAKDEGVYAAARDGIRYVSRNAEFFGLPPADKPNPTALADGK